MEGPCATSSLYVTLAHEYGFSGSNLKSLLDICGFDDIRIHSAAIYGSTFRQRLGRILPGRSSRKISSSTDCLESTAADNSILN